MSNKFLFSLAMTGLLVATAGADGTTTTVESTNLLFSVTASSATISGTPWTSPTSGTASRTGSTIDVDTAASDPLKYAGTFSGATRYRVKGNMTVTLNASVPDNTVFGETLPKAALVAVAGSPNNKWYGWDGDSWVDLSSGITTAPAEGTSYNVAIEFFVESSQLKIKYIVGNESQTVTTSESALPTLTYVGLAGYGSFGDFAAIGYEEFEVVVPAANVDAVKEAMQISEITSETLNTKGSNGLTVWESIVLGLESPSTKPYTAPVQTSGDALGFTIGNVDTAKYGATGATVTFDVVECNSDGSNEQAIAGETANNVAAGETATVTAPSGVKYYKIKIKITK